MIEELQDIIDTAAAVEDQSVASTGAGSDYQPPAAGFTVGRLVEYVELGVHPQKPYMGTPKKPCEEVRIVFDLLGPKNIREVDVNGVKTKVCDRIVIKTMPKLLADKAKFFKLFCKMQDGRKNIKHMSQMLGEAFMLKIVHVKSEDGKTTYANIRDADGSWLVFPPVQPDPLNPDELKPLNVPPAISKYRLFVWNNPTVNTWVSLFMDGTYKAKDAAGVEQEYSKNTIQDKIMTALNYVDSPLYTMLNSADTAALADLTEPPAKAKKPAKKQTAQTDVSAALADLGLLT